DRISNMAKEESLRKRGYTFKDVFRFAVPYWWEQPRRFSIIVILIATAAFLETNLPNALSSFFEAIRKNGSERSIISRLAIFLVIYLAYTLLYNWMYRIYNVFENITFKRVLDDAFAHVQSLSEQFFVNTFTGSIITTVKRGRDRIETFEDQIILNIFPTGLIVTYSIILLALRFPLLA